MIARCRFAVPAHLKILMSRRRPEPRRTGFDALVIQAGSPRCSSSMIRDYPFRSTRISRPGYHSRQPRCVLVYVPGKAPKVSFNRPR